MSLPLIQMSTGAAFAVVRKRCSLSRSAASARTRLVMSRMNPLNTRSSPNPIGVIASSTGNSVPSRCMRRHLDALVQHARDAGFDVALQAAAMLIAQALGDDELGELAAQRFGAWPAEQLLGVGIPAGDDSLVVDRDHAVECGFDDELVALLGKPQRTFGRASQGVRAFAARSIDPDEGDEDHGARERKKRHRGFESQRAVAVRNTASASPPAAAR